MSYKKSQVLVIDSAHSVLFVAVVSGDNVCYLTNEIQREHDKHICELVGAVLKKAGCEFSDICAYAVVVGPGSWTGCRVGVAAVKGFLLAHSKPIIPIKSLDVLEKVNTSQSKIVAVKSNLDNYFVKRGQQYACEKVSDISTLMTLQDVGFEAYHTQLCKEAWQCLLHKKFCPDCELRPFYITNFVVKS